MKKIFTFFTMATSMFAFGQTADFVNTGGGASDVYYDFETKTQYKVDSRSWDIGLTTDLMDASILINENAGVELFVYSTDTSNWASIDTAGFAFENVYNSEDNWAEGAFANQGTRHPDYGWGIYNMNSHDIAGNRLFIIKTKEGDYLKAVVDVLTRGGEFTIRTAKLDGSDAKTHVFSKQDRTTTGKNFGFLNIATEQISTENPESKMWDLLFARYVTTVMQGPVTQDMAVSGIKINKGCEVAERSGVDVMSNDTSSLSWNSNITEIGYDWKSFDRGTFRYNMTQDLTYFVRTTNGGVWKIYFTGYQGGRDGQSNFVTEEIKQGVASSSAVSKLNTKVYPNPASGVVTIANSENAPINVSIIDVTGKVVYGSDVLANSELSVDVSAFESGIYFVQMESNSTVTTSRLMVE